MSGPGDSEVLGNTTIREPATHAEKADRKRFHTLDGLRGVAALFVAGFHFDTRNDTSPFPGYLAVDLFFVLSGFVIALNYSEKLRGALTLGGFARVRAVRLLPMYALGFALGCLKQLFGVLAHDPRALRTIPLVCSMAMGALMLPSPCTQTLFPLNGPSWSLFFEVLINLMFAFWLWNASTQLLLALISLSLAALILTIGSPLEFNTGWSWTTAHVALFRATFSFPVGILIYRLFNRRVVVTWAAILPVALMSFALAFLPPRHLIAAEQLFVVAVIFPIIVMMGLRLEAPRFLARIFSFLGDISYPVYALHIPILPIGFMLLARTGLPHTGQLLAWLTALIFFGYSAARADARIRSYVNQRIYMRPLRRSMAAPQF